MHNTSEKYSDNISLTEWKCICRGLLLLRYKSVLSSILYLRDTKYPIKFEVETKYGGESSHVKDWLNRVGNMQKQSKHKKDNGKGGTPCSMQFFLVLPKPGLRATDWETVLKKSKPVVEHKLNVLEAGYEIINNNNKKASRKTLSPILFITRN